MRRIGKLEPALFGDAAGPRRRRPGYRMRVRLHAGRRARRLLRSGHAPRRARPGLRGRWRPRRARCLPAIEEAIRAAGARGLGGRDPRGSRAGAPPAPRDDRRRRAPRGPARRRARGPASRASAVRRRRWRRPPPSAEIASLDVDVGAAAVLGLGGHVLPGQPFPRRRSCSTPSRPRAEARRAGDALDAFGGVGLFAGALLDAGHRVVSVEADPGAVGDARRTRERWKDGGRWEIAEAPAAPAFSSDDDRRFDVVVADPPRAGLGTALAAALARRARAALRLRLLRSGHARRATCPRSSPRGSRSAGARLYDLFAFTHRVEALVALERAA